MNLLLLTVEVPSVTVALGENGFHSPAVLPEGTVGPYCETAVVHMF